MIKAALIAVGLLAPSIYLAAAPDSDGPACPYHGHGTTCYPDGSWRIAPELAVCMDAPEGAETIRCMIVHDPQWAARSKRCLWRADICRLWGLNK